MKDIDFIKRAIKDAEGYQLTDDDGVLCISEQQSLTSIPELKEGFPVHYRDIIQCAIESNILHYNLRQKVLEEGFWLTRNLSDGIGMFNEWFEFGETTVETKEEALKYFYNKVDLNGK